ncbi:MAG TPA: DEAD/DEAH box helicase [Methylococcaceae bacterium]|jgi:ATP-dependent RNA helicase DeaD|nr:DEAD/DEAH box helicase [Methylococcaceae bacterium]HIN68869.1 DEAD/DEAH box helicase [Methylococcales bacterium]HIA45459.1 DEAD/DEAH box helicase [Methylococcaceae bacterium]HIB63174.1 DEAD/DEAH box helicase [Methylococcaceae bacterium]HIO13012.1 DEAD/DEAH box helicase [Methylococcales bacterium]
MTLDTTVILFKDLNLSDPVLKGLNSVGYETPTPIQAQTIPPLLAGKDVLGEAQTGTGKTAAFALPILSRIDTKKKIPQVLVLAPTRELAIQVAEAFQTYAAKIKGFHVLPVYGGQDYSGQIRALKRGVHVVVGTPGRVMDHMRRGTLNVSELDCLVLDEADEMLRMGFIDDVEWVMEQTPQDRQIALFSATMPKEVRRIAQRFLKDPKEITIKVKTTTAETIRQRFMTVSGVQKLDALTRILEVESFDAIIIFVRTKTATVELTEKLLARGYGAAAINGDIAQNQRERTINQFKKGKLDILIATDVAARGLDVQRISHVINYDIPYDTESYVHRIGRTGRAGREGEAILFVAPREKRMLSSIERATRKKIEPMELPSTKVINEKRVDRFKDRINDTIASGDLVFFEKLLTDYQQEHDVSTVTVAAALAKLLQGDEPMLIEKSAKRQRGSDERSQDRRSQRSSDDRNKGRKSKERNQSAIDKDTSQRPPRKGAPGVEMELFRLEVGKNDGVEPGNIVGAIANETGLEGDLIQKIKIFDDHSTVHLPEGMPRSLLRSLKKVWVSGKQLNVTIVGGKKKPKAEG